MIKLKGLSDEQIREISRRIADAFFDYKYNEEDIGLIKYISTREDMFTYMNAIVRAAYKSGVLYATSEKQEGYSSVPASATAERSKAGCEKRSGNSCGLRCWLYGRSIRGRAL